MSGQTNVYDLTMADQPTQAGTPLTKANLLKDATAAALGLGSGAVPDDALAAIADYINNDAPSMEHGYYTGTGVFGSANYNELTFQRGIPWLVIIAPPGGSAPVSVFINPIAEVRTFGARDSGGICTATWSIAQRLRWYAGSHWSGSTTSTSASSTVGSANQLNSSGVTYRYVAIF